ncbi:MAG: dehydrogenase [Armatimonadetes bacterium]|nr:dehydrogenase [Armatimonadota bacterium]
MNPGALALPPLEHYAPALLCRLYRDLLLARMVEERMLLALRQGRISKWFSGIGQEAISVGSAAALEAGEHILPLHRNLGAFTSRGVPLRRLFAQFLGKPGGFTQGRDRSFHFGSPEHHIVGMISHLGPQLAVADGIALADRLDGCGRATLAFTGEGATSEGDFHEALNLAAVWDLPVIFLIENNGYALSTPLHEQYRCDGLVTRAPGYGVEGLQVDGNDVLEVYWAVGQAAASVRKEPRPVLIEALTFRIRGHEEASGTAYVPPELIERWQRRDPVASFFRKLCRFGLWSKEQEGALRAELGAEIEEALAGAYEEPGASFSARIELGGVYRQHEVPQVTSAASDRRDLRFVDAISEGLREGMRRHPELVLMGQDIAEYGGVFKVTRGFLEEFGRERVRNTPLCESAVVGAALGLSIRGKKSMVEMQFSDFASCAFNQIVNNLARVHYRWGQPADVVIRMPTGAGVGAGPFHSQSLEAFFFHCPGLKLVYPAFPEDAKGLLLAALADPDPVLYFEHKALYRRLRGSVPTGYYTTPLGRARWVRQGDEVAIITYGLGVHWALETLEKHPEVGATLLDLRSLVPLDWEAVREAVQRAGKVLVLHEDTLRGGIGAEIAAWIQEHCFEHLDAPVVRCASLDMPVPFARELEREFLPQGRLEETLLELLAY